MIFLRIKNILIDALFPKRCLSCEKEGNFLCQDCFSLIDISDNLYCPFCYPQKIFKGTCSLHKKQKYLDGLYFAVSYNNYIVKEIIHQLKYQYVKELAKTSVDLIIAHFLNLTSEKYNSKNQLKEIQKIFFNSVLIPIPLFKRKLKERGFNQSEEIAKNLSIRLNAPVAKNVLIKTKENKSQTNLEKSERLENVKGVFTCLKENFPSGKKIFLIDDVFTTGATMEEAAKVLKQSGANQVWGIAVARGS